MCNQTFFFQELDAGNSRQVVADFNGGRLSSDGGVTLVAELDRKLGLTESFAECFNDLRDPRFTEHSVTDLLRQRVYGLSLGYEDLNDHDILRSDALLAACVGKEDVLGEERVGQGREGFALAGKSTLNRLELSAQRVSNYHKISADSEAIENFFIETGVKCIPRHLKEIVIDFDATDDLIHGDQEGRFFHGYYGNYCYMPLYAFCGDIPLVAKLRPSDKDGAEGTLEYLQRIVRAVRKRFGKHIRIILRGDSGFCRDALMSWCEDNGLYYCLGLKRNARLEKELEPAMFSAKQMAILSGGYSTFFTEFEYQTLKSWTRSRRVIGKAQVLPKGTNPRFVVTNIPLEGFEDDPARRFEPKHLYRDFYCARGDMENRIKEQQLDLFADRTSTHWMASNQLRLWFSTLAYLLLTLLRSRLLEGTKLARASVGTIRLRLFKIATAIKISVRRILLSMSSTYPLQELFKTAQHRLNSLEAL